MRSIVESLLLGALILFPAEVLAQASCPSTVLTCNDVESSRVEPQGQVACPGNSSASYDAIRGTVSASAYHSCCATVSSQARVFVHDVFTVVGLPPGQSLTFHARMTGGASGCGSSFGGGSADIGLGDDASRNAEGNYTNFAYVGASGGTRTCSSASGTAQIPLTIVTGDSIALGYYARAGGTEGGSGSCSGILSFADLPPGATVRSCHGFAQEFPVATLPVSWGRLKQRYR